MALFGFCLDLAKSLNEFIIKLASLLGISVFESVEFNKLNILELKEVEDLSNISYYAHQEYINTEIKKPDSPHLVINDYRTLTMKNPDEKAHLYLKYGLNSPTSKEGKTKHIFIEIDIATENVATVEAFATIRKTNKELFDVFNWTITHKLINLLEDETSF